MSKTCWAVEVEQLTVNYDKTPVLWDLNFQFPKGELIGILGPNGAGKSTLLKVMLGILKPLSGQIRFWGKSWPQIQRKVAYIPQHSSVDWSFPVTALDVVTMGRYGHLRLFQRPANKEKTIALAALEMVGMRPFADKQIDQFSGGQKQRLFLARALAQQADLYLFDEPFSGVDPTTEKTILALLRQLKEEGKTICVVHHHLATVSSYFDWLLLLNTCLIACGPTEEVFLPHLLTRTYGKNNTLLDEAAFIAQKRIEGKNDRASMLL